jgi:hypothetical protein
LPAREEPDLVLVHRPRSGRALIEALNQGMRLGHGRVWVITLAVVSRRRIDMDKLQRPFRRVPRLRRGPQRLGAVRLGALAVGSAAIGAGAVGALAIGRLAIGRAVVRRLKIEELEVQRLRVHDLQVDHEHRPAVQA